LSLTWYEHPEPTSGGSISSPQHCRSAPNDGTWSSKNVFQVVSLVTSSPVAPSQVNRLFSN